MPDETAFAYDVFLSHSAKDKPIVRDIAERLKKDGVKQSEFVIRHSSFGFCWLCMSAHAFGSDWARLACPAVPSERRGKPGTFRFRDPLNKERRQLLYQQTFQNNRRPAIHPRESLLFFVRRTTYS